MQISWLIVVKFGRGDLNIIRWQVLSFVELSAVKSVRYLKALINFYPNFPHLLSDVGTVPCETSALSGAGRLWVAWTRTHGRSALLHA
jgi:hypothetical protein